MLLAGGLVEQRELVTLQIKICQCVTLENDIVWELFAKSQHNIHIKHSDRKSEVEGD